jgi:hypothetical protein
MRIAHIIMAHKNPNQLKRLVERLNHPNFDVYIHIDKKALIDDFQQISTLNQVWLLKDRIDCNWGGNSLLTGILRALKEVTESGKNYDFINLISAQDYPLVPTEDMYNYFYKNLGTNFLSFEESKDSEWWKKAVHRYEKYHLTDYNFKGKYLVQKVLNTFLPKRKFPLEIDLYGGCKSTWWTISGECAKYVIEALLTNRKLNNFLKFSWGTDEFAIPSIIMNSPFKKNTINENMRYIDWSEGNAHPKLLGSDDFEKIKSSGMLFGRKFDIEFDEAILNKIDRECLGLKK